MVRRPAAIDSAHRAHPWRRIAAAMALALVTLLAYADSLWCGFPLDNEHILLRDPRMEKAGLENVKLIFAQDYWYPTGVGGLYRPLTSLTYLANRVALSGHPFGYHLVNLGLHLANVFMVYGLARAVMGEATLAFLAALLFAVHPIAVESVTNIVGRADMLAATSILGGLLLYIRSTRSHGWRRVAWLIGMMLVNLAGVFCKESAMALVGVLLVYDVAFRMERKHPRLPANVIANLGSFFLRGYIVLVPVWVTFAVVRHAVFSRLDAPTFAFVDNPILGADFWSGRFTAIKVIGKLLWLLVWPATLSCDYGYNEVPLVDWHFRRWEDVQAFLSRWEDVQAIVALLVILALLGLALVAYRRQKPLFFLILFLFVTLAPTSNIFVRIGSIMAERFVYLPMAAFVGCVVLATEALVRRTPGLHGRRMLWLAIGALTLCYGLRTFTP